jgi:hypothetical protein
MEDSTRLPAGDCERIFAGEAPLKVWREFRGLEQSELRAEGGIRVDIIDRIAGHERAQPGEPVLAIGAEAPGAALPRAGDRLLEWSGEKGSKREHWFSVPSHEIFAFAGVWRPTEQGNAYAFLTCEPNPGRADLRKSDAGDPAS